MNHFTVPDGYFDSFAERLMEQLPESDTRVIKMRPERLWHRLPIRRIAAVVGVVAVLIGGGVFYAGQSSKSQKAIAHTVAEEHVLDGGSTEYGTFDQMADYTMMDNQDIYASLVSDNQGGI